MAATMSEANETLSAPAAPPPAAQGLFYDEDGNLQEMYVGADIDGDGDVDQGDLGEFLAALADPIGYQQQYPDRFIRADLNADGTVDQADLGIFLAIMGMSENNAVWARFTWDAENRLIGFEPQEPTEGSLKVEFKYDYLGRRVEKAVYAWDPELNAGEGGWENTPTLHRRFVWYNWLLLEELDVDASGAVTGVAKKYTWGLDLAGLWGGQTSSLSSLEGAGGIGGLLAVHDPEDDPTPDKNYVFFCDANGNVGQLIDWENDGTLVAKYEYDPYGGNLLDPTDPQESGPYAADNPWRFSTKYFDAETALGYWGYRYYSPRLGRWIRRDPIGVTGGVNLQAFVENLPTGAVDLLGEKTCGPWEDRRPPRVFMDVERREIGHDYYTTGRGGKTFWPYDFAVDYQILYHVRVKLILAGPSTRDPVEGDDAEMYIYDYKRWEWPRRLDEICKWSLDHNFERRKLHGVACRKWQRCVRECERCCFEDKYRWHWGALERRWVGFDSWTETSWTVSSHAGQNPWTVTGQWVYGQLDCSDASPFCFCKLAPAGALIRFDYARSWTQPADLKCTGNDAPACSTLPENPRHVQRSVGSETRFE